MQPTNANAYLRTKVTTARPEELRLMLFDGAIRFAEQARTALAQKEHESAYISITRCQNILLELMNALRPEHDRELCSKLSGLYTFMYTQLLKASTQHDPAPVDEVLELLRFERETWVLLLAKLARENQAAHTLQRTPDAQPSVPPSSDAATSGLVSASVCLRG